MKKTLETIVFFGNERLATGVQTIAPTLQALVETGYNVAAVVANYEAGQSRNPRGLEIKEIAERYQIPLLLPSKPTDIADELRSYGAAIGVLVAYGKIVPQPVIDIFPRGIVNIHPSLLPLHRGPIPIESVILNGETRTGVSIMSLVKAMDAGPVYGQAELALQCDEVKQGLADTLLDIGTTLLLELLPSILDGTVTALPQDDSRATYDKLLSKKDGYIDWTKPALQIEREIRAFIGWPKSRTTLGGKEVIVTEASVVEGSGSPGHILSDKDLTIFTGINALEIKKLKPAGKQEMTAEAFLAGYGHLLST